MKKRLFWGASSLVALAVLIATVVSSTPRSTVKAQVTLPGCPTGFAVGLNTTTALLGVVPINIATPTGITVDRIIIRLDGEPMGQARRNTTNPSVWSMPWPTQLAEPGAHQLNLHVFYNQSQQCQTPPQVVNVAPSPIEADVVLDVNPPSWSGLTNSVFDISAIPQANVGLPSSEINPYVVYQWETNIGTVSPGINGARFASGASAGTGRVRVKVFYGGEDAEREIGIAVLSQNQPITNNTGSTAPLPSPTSTPTTTSTTTAPTTTTTTTSTAPLTEQQKVELIAKQIDSQPEILSCASSAITQARIDQLRLSGRRLSPAEFAQVVGCFSQTSYVVPSSYAPVEPAVVREQTPESSSTRIRDMKTTDIEPQEGQKRQALRFEGQADPNANVLIYVFSEPLVLYAKADANGNWVYDLVDPMQPGNHEAYAVVEASDGTYRRSSPFSFLVETASASSENPGGYSFSVQTVGSLSPPASKRGISLYMVGSAFVVVAVLVVGAVIMKKTLSHLPDDDNGTAGHGYGGQ